jgi:hypothetical protein
MIVHDIEMDEIDAGGLHPPHLGARRPTANSNVVVQAGLFNDPVHASERARAPRLLAWFQPVRAAIGCMVITSLST